MLSNVANFSSAGIVLTFDLTIEKAEIWKAHQIEIRIGNFGLQQDSLSAAGPLFAKEKLHYCGVFKIPHDAEDDPEYVHHICFRFDKTLKTFGDERKRIDLLMSKYLDDNSISYSEWVVKLCQEFL
ncbi:hypothetical protein C1646_759288 [Rhizophagus diaphanus]|nr:hypothetical protein C1646_759288 [Rhizophagus diaphanus] [Rhizophagus sp. MUCL 43196]